MKFIAHRVNTIEELSALPTEYGVEIDLRDKDDRLILVHDPFSNGEDFENYLKQYHHGTMILNIKSERIEHRVLELLQKYSISDYFFLDSSFPMIKLLSDKGEMNTALRFSEFEGIDTLKAMQGKVKWVWIDCFNNFPLERDTYRKIKEMGYKTCFVSPELQGQGEKIELYADDMRKNGIEFDAICTKSYNIPKWQSL